MSIRTAAQREAEARYAGTWRDEVLDAFIAGTVWGAARVTPTREQTVSVLIAHPYFDAGRDSTGATLGKCACGARFQGGPNSPAYAEHVAGALAALMTELAEGEG